MGAGLATHYRPTRSTRQPRMAGRLALLSLVLHSAVIAGLLLKRPYQTTESEPEPVAVTMAFVKQADTSGPAPEAPASGAPEPEPAAHEPEASPPPIPPAPTTEPPPPPPNPSVPMTPPVPPPPAPPRPVPERRPQRPAPPRLPSRPANPQPSAAPADKSPIADGGQAATSRAGLASNGAAWTGKLKQWWDQNSFYPREASQTNEGGSVRVRIAIAADGQVTAVGLVQGSGSSVLDAAALAVFRGAHLPPFPAGTLPQPAEVVITVHYRPGDAG